MYNNPYNRNGGRPNQGYGQNRPSLETVVPKPLPEDYVQRAQDAIQQLDKLEKEYIENKKDKDRKDKDRKSGIITTSKLRSLFSLFAETYNEVVRGDQEKLTPAQVNALNAAKIRVYYEVGREDGYKGNLDYAPVGRFVKHSEMLAYLYDVGDSCEKLIQFYHYMEALVAFHRYYFGEAKDNR